MSNYTKTTNFASKDNLSPGNPLKIVKGAEIDTEFNNIQTAVATKTDNSAANITGGSITGITDLAVADGGTGASTATAALNNLLPSQSGNANKYLQTDGTNASWDAVSLSTSDITGTLPVANGGTGVTSSTGTGDVVLSNSPTLVTPALGTPSSGTATNLTGLPISTGVSGLGTGVATFLGTPSSANLASAVTDETGSGALVFANSPTLVTPTLGTPASAILTNATGLPISTGVSGLGTGVASFLATPSSANLATAVSDETGSGALVFANSPTLVTPALGTPSSGTLTNATGLPIATGVSGLGTGVATALAVNVGSSGAPLVNGGALGTPSSGTATNLTGLPISTGVSGLGTGVATFLGTPSSANLASAVTDETGTGALVFANNPTLVTPALGTPASGVATNLTGLPLSTGVTGTLPVANGGTGQTSYTDGQLLIGNSTGNTLTKATLTAGSGITVTNSAGGITIAATGGGGSGDVVGPSSATDNGVALFDGTTGKLLKNSSATDGLLHGLTVGRGAGAVSTNTAVGASALAANTSGYQNASFGYVALQANTTGYNNAAFGEEALYLNTTGALNTGVGQEALRTNTTGSSNTAVGEAALRSNTTASENTAVGYQSMYSNTTGDGTALGYRALYTATNRTSNTAVGNQALFSCATDENTAVGALALRDTSTGTANTAMGVQAGVLNTTGSSNTAIGYLALNVNTTGSANTAIGRQALVANTTASNNTAVGMNALYSNNTADNTAVGAYSLYTSTVAGNTAIGARALQNSSTGAENAACGMYALYNNTTGSNNSGCGYQALFDNSTGSNNSAIGFLAGYGTGSNANTTGSNNTFIGYQSVGASASASNVITLGNSSIATLRCQVTSITSLSDARDKTNINNIPAGLSFVQALRPVSFDWNMRDGHKVGIHEFGFIAQELLSAQEQTGVTVPNLVSTENPEKLEASAGTLIPVLVKAIQELKAEFDAYKSTHP